MPVSSAHEVTAERIATRIVLVRGQKALLDVDLADLYGISTGRLNEQVKRNLRRFPPDFMFRLNNQDLVSLKSQIAISSSMRSWGGRRRSFPLAFTEHGALMAANVLSSRRAIEISIFVVRAFVRLRETLASHKDLARKLDELERKTAALSSKHDALTRDTRARFQEVIEALRNLMSGPEPRRRPIGFVTPR
jgi:phage regulator Rha-like protein